MDLSRASWSSHAWVLGLAVASAVACSSTTDTNADPAKSGPTDGERIESGSTTSGQFNASDAAAPAAGGCVPNSAYFDVPGNGCDDDGDGIVDNTSCDDALAADGSAEDFAKAVGLCHKAGDNGHGVISAKFTRGYGRTDEPKPDQHGVLAKFGDVLTPREGARFGVLSTGYAKEFNGSANTPFGGEVAQAPYIYGKDWWNYGVYKAGKAGTGTLPPGYPKPASGCTQVATVNDVIDVKLELRAPLNAIGIKFDFNFLSGEWPAFVCSSFNDGFAAFVTAPSINGGQITNISFDKNENPVSVNNAFFDRCTPDVQVGCADDAKPGKSACAGGASELAGTGFGIVGKWCALYDGKNSSVSGGATGWLTSQVAITPGETFTLEWIIWDTGDALNDSSVLLDNITWVPNGNVPVVTTTERPPR